MESPAGVCSTSLSQLAGILHYCNRRQVEATIRAWFPFMAVSESERTAVQQEWEQQYFSLPPDMQAEQLAAGRVMSIPPLPTRSDTTRVPVRHAVAAPNPSARLENPVVDLTHGGAPGHRSSADVQRDLAAYR